MKRIRLLSLLLVLLPALTSTTSAQVAHAPFTGKIALHIADDFENGTTSEGYVLYDVRVAGISVPGDFDLLLPAGTVLPHGGTLDGVGTLVYGKIAVTAINSITEPGAPEYDGPTAWRTLVMLVNLSDLDQPCDKSEVEFEWFGDSADSVELFFDEMSYGDFDLEATVVGPYTISASSGSCSPSKWANQADAQAKNEVPDFDQYDSYYYITPRVGSGCSGGVARRDRAWSFGICTDNIYAHELGHNLGLGHSNSETAAYGDTSCTMGGSTGPNLLRHFNSAHKSFLGWIPEGRIVDVTSSGLYNLSAVEYAIGGFDQILRLPLQGPEDYYISYRTSTGNFGGHLQSKYTEKMSVHRGVGIGRSTVFVSETASNESPYPKAWDDGETFVGQGGNFCATQVSHNGIVSSIWVSLECETPPPACPEVAPCNGTSSLEGGETGSTDTGLATCVDGLGQLLECSAGQSVHVIHTACNKAPCCYELPSCFCPLGNFGDGTRLECR